MQASADAHPDAEDVQADVDRDAQADLHGDQRSADEHGHSEARRTMRGMPDINPDVPPHGPTAYSDTGEYDDDGSGNPATITLADGFTISHAEHKHPDGYGHTAYVIRDGDYFRLRCWVCDITSAPITIVERGAADKPY